MSGDDFTDEDELDAIAARDAEPAEDPRAEIGYQSPPRPAPPESPKPADPDRLLFCDGGGSDCQGYKLGALMFQRPGGGGPHCWCAGCVGQWNVRAVDRVRECIRGLKSAAAVGNGHDERERYQELVGLVGKHQADETAKAIRDKLDEKPTGGRGRR